MAALIASASLVPTATTNTRPPSSSANKTQALANNPIVSALSVGGKETSSSTNWAPDSWRSKPVLQIPAYPYPGELESVVRSLETYPPLVFAGEARNLEERPAEAAFGRAFVLQGADCAERFKEFSVNNIRDTFRLLLQMGVVLTFGGQMPTIKVEIFYSSFRSNPML